MLMPELYLLDGDRYLLDLCVKEMTRYFFSLKVLLCKFQNS